ncbi:hypothetical protein AQUCO_09100040v1 [Aquilegia coerulea]|uniref:Uncharacterized protein n=1 Tax=Aquilegia coerulea TaxID=218851 RepID=A0A2G5C5M5_AQUCA|nr:hypothetical protein AQUCO_09100040v1 [Aquilegia coerulea]
MNCSLSFYSSARVLPSSFHTSCKLHSTPNALKGKQQHTVLSQNHEIQERLLVQKSSLHRDCGLKPANQFWPQKTASLAIQVGAFLAAVDQPAFAVTGVNNEEPLSWKLIQLGIIAFWYLLIMPAQMETKDALRDVFAVHVCVHVLSGYFVMGTIYQQQATPSRSNYEIPMVNT